MQTSSILFSFEGRIGRQTFWFATLATSLINCMISVVLVGVARGLGSGVGQGSGDVGVVPIIVLLLWVPVAAWVSLAIQAKRWHDRDKSGWWILICLVPIIGSIWALIETGFLRGTNAPNRFGVDPLLGF
jgi:uncharacterized membrane protein YhaH (DUF805 family)